MTPQLKYHTIAGHHSGKRISCKPELVPAFQNLRRAAQSGNYWATIAVRELDSLSSGLDGKSNVYFRPGDRDGSSGTQRIIVFLPGLKATLLKWGDGNFRIVELELDGMYELTKQAVEHTRLGLYRVRSSSEESGKGSWTVRYDDKGHVLAKPGRLVTIPDSRYATAAIAANKVIPRAITAPEVRATEIVRSGCDLHFTPGEKRLGGLIAYNSMSINSSRASAVHLAESMIQARQVKGVVWLADRGGSAVLTQAMQILVDKGVSLKGHTAYLYKPRTSPAHALRLAHSLEMTLNESFADTGMSIRGALSQLSVSNLRLNNKNDLYNKKSFLNDLISGLMKAAAPTGVVTAGALGLGVATGAGSLGATIVMVGAIAGAISTGGTIIGLGQSVAEEVRHRIE